MKASKLIEKLQAIIGEFGDLEVGVRLVPTSEKKSAVTFPIASWGESNFSYEGPRALLNIYEGHHRLSYPTWRGVKMRFKNSRQTERAE